jgi:hypothetical protein
MSGYDDEIDPLKASVTCAVVLARLPPVLAARRGGEHAPQSQIPPKVGDITSKTAQRADLALEPVGRAVGRNSCNYRGCRRVLPGNREAEG